VGRGAPALIVCVSVLLERQKKLLQITAKVESLEREMGVRRRRRTCSIKAIKSAIVSPSYLVNLFFEMFLKLRFVHEPRRLMVSADELPWRAHVESRNQVIIGSKVKFRTHHSLNKDA